MATNNKPSLEAKNITPFFALFDGGGKLSEEARLKLDEMWRRINEISTEDGVLKLSGTPSNIPGSIWIEGLVTSASEASVEERATIPEFDTVEEEIQALWNRINMISTEDGAIKLGNTPSNEIGAMWIEG